MSNNEKYLVNIEDLENTPNKKIQFDFEDFIDEIKSKTPIKANLEITSLSDFIEIKGNIQGTAMLECDLCLEEFSYDFDIDVDEMFAKNTLIEDDDEIGGEIEIKDGQFITDLKGSQDIDIYDLLYQSVILDFPNKKVCGIKCKGQNFLNDENFTQNEADPRLAVFKNIKIQDKPTKK